MRTIQLLTPLTTTEKKQIALDMAVHAAKMLNYGDVTDPSIWRGMLREIGCYVIAWRDCRPCDVAQFIPVPDISNQYPLGIVQYNVRQDRTTRARGLCHEFGHALLHSWVPVNLYDADVVYSYHDDASSVRHQIARHFEKMVMG